MRQLTFEVFSQFPLLEDPRFCNDVGIVLILVSSANFRIISFLKKFEEILVQ